MAIASVSPGALAAPDETAVPPAPGISKPAAPKSAAEPRIKVSGVSFSGNHVFSQKQLSAQIAGDIGRKMTFSEVTQLAKTVERFYHDAGYKLTSVVIPRQQFADGNPVRLVVLEGQLGQIKMHGNKRYARQRIVDTLDAAGVRQSEAFKLASVERALTLINRRSGVEVSSTLKPGADQGSTDLVVDVDESDRITGSVEANNYGSDNSGDYRLVSSLNLPNATGRGDQVDLLGLVSLGAKGDDGNSYLAYAAYETPINSIGTKVNTYVTQGTVDIGQEFRVLEIEGDSFGAGLGVSQDFILSARNILTIEASLELKNLEQSVLGSTSSKDMIRKLRLGASYDRSDLSGRTLLSFGVHQGLGDTLGAMENNSELSSRSFAGADNRFTRFTFDLTRLQRLNNRFLLVPRFYGQYAIDPVVASEQWAVGGINSVVGHPPSIFSGDSGFTTTVEARYTLFADDDRYQVISQLGHGEVFIKKPFIGQDDHESISGFGLGFLATPLSKLNLRIDVGVPISSKTGDSVYGYAQARYGF